MGMQLSHVVAIKFHEGGQPSLLGASTYWLARLTTITTYARQISRGHASLPGQTC
jgi:hypothetical protein